MGPRSTLWLTFRLPLVTRLQYTQVKKTDVVLSLCHFNLSPILPLHEDLGDVWNRGGKELTSFSLLCSIITKKDLWHPGHQSQLHHTDRLWRWQIQTTTSIKLVCSDSEVSILTSCILLNLHAHIEAALVVIYFCVFRNRTGGKRTSFSWKQRVFMLLLVGVLGFFTLIIIMAKLGRASAGSDPNLDPLLNPNIRIGKNWKQA